MSLTTIHPFGGAKAWAQHITSRRTEPRRDGNAGRAGAAHQIDLAHRQLVRGAPANTGRAHVLLIEPSNGNAEGVAGGGRARRPPCQASSARWSGSQSSILGAWVHERPHRCSRTAAYAIGSGRIAGCFRFCQFAHGQLPSFEARAAARPRRPCFEHLPPQYCSPRILVRYF